MRTDPQGWSLPSPVITEYRFVHRDDTLGDPRVPVTSGGPGRGSIGSSNSATYIPHSGRVSEPEPSLTRSRLAGVVRCWCRRRSARDLQLLGGTGLQPRYLSWPLSTEGWASTLAFPRELLAEVVQLATIVAFLRWLHLAVCHAQAMGRRVTSSPRAAVLWWFVSVANSSCRSSGSAGSPPRCPPARGRGAGSLPCSFPFSRFKRGTRAALGI